MTYTSDHVVFFGEEAITKASAFAAAHDTVEVEIHHGYYTGVLVAEPVSADCAADFGGNLVVYDIVS